MPIATDRPVSRRRFLRLTALTAAALPLLSGRAAMAGAAAEPLRWQGRSLGADAEIILYHHDPAQARAALADGLAEIERLEAVFSLYRPDTALSRLNAHGHLPEPPLDLVRLLSESRRFAEITNGAFDPTVQSLWRLYEARLQAGGQPPEAAELRRALDRVDWRRIEISPAAIGFQAPGMAVTLNGIAQGYITDRVADLLRARGFTNVLLDLGEMRALGPKSDGQAWRAAIRDPRRAEAVLHEMPLTEGAMATSAPGGSHILPGLPQGHIFDPRTGLLANAVSSVTVIAPTATAADALSTALAVLPRDQWSAVLALAGASRAIAIEQDGNIRDITV